MSQPSSDTRDVLIIGAGLAGLCCARHLQQHGVSCRILEATDGVGGRIRTDRQDGFLLDRGFQVFLTSYPEARLHLDYQALQLRPFLPGALVRYRGRFHDVSDPWRRPIAALRAIGSPIGSLQDKLRVARFRTRVLRGTIEDHLNALETTSLEALQSSGFSPAIIERFFRPFFGGVFLDRELVTSSRMLSFVFRMFALGEASLPADGMEAIPRQLAATLLPDTIRFGARVARIQPGCVNLNSGEELRARSIVVAGDAPAAAELLGNKLSSAGRGTTCLYFAAPHSPLAQPILVLNGDGRGPINNLCVPTLTAPSYGPGDQSLVSITVLGIGHASEQLVTEVQRQLGEWFGTTVEKWRHLRTYSIPYALPDQMPPALATPERSVRWEPGIFVCGDHRNTASINGAMVSGRQAADAVLQDRVP